MPVKPPTVENNVENNNGNVSFMLCGRFDIFVSFASFTFAFIDIQPQLRASISSVWCCPSGYLCAKWS